jgi:two-component system alkaline phosphatase synthesis response regulator PhoP
MSVVYYVEDDESIRTAVVYALNASGFEVERFEEAAQFWSALAERIPDLVLLDIMLPGEDGLQILKKIRARPDLEHLPVILVTAKGAEFEKVLGLDSGADDYVAKPFGVMELISRIKALLRRAARQAAPEPGVLSSGGVTLDPEKHLVTVDGAVVELTLKEFGLLHALLKSPGRVFTRAELLDLVWGYETDVETRTVDVHIGTVRQKLGPYGTWIRTVRGLGYKFVELERQP